MSGEEGSEPHQLMPPVVPAAAARAQVRAVAFDCYGTLLALEERQFAALIHAMLLGHGIRDVPGLLEVSIGHAVICRALEVGIATAVGELRAVLDPSFEVQRQTR